MRHKRKTLHIPKGFRFALFGLMLALAILIGGAWYWNTYKNEIIRAKIEEAIEEGSKGLYQANYDSLALDETAGYLAIYNLQLSFDSTRYKMETTDPTIPPILLNISVPRIVVTGIQTPRALLEKEIRGRMMEIHNPVVELFYTYKGKDAARNVPTKQVYEQILGKLRMISLDSILVIGAHLRTRNLKTGQVIVDAKDVDLSLGEVRVDSLAEADTSRIFFSRNLDLKAEEINWSSPNGLYNYSMVNSQLNSIKSEVQIARFIMQPVLGEDVFVKRLKVQDDRYDFRFNKIRLSNLDVQKLMNEELEGDTLYLPSPSFKVYRDLALPRDHKNRIGNYPHQVLEDIPVSISIKKILVTNAFVEYKERNHITRQSGRVQFHNVFADINNFTNDKKRLGSNRIMTASVNGSFLNTAPLRTNWIFYLQNHQGRFAVKGSLGPMDVSQLNQLAEPMGPARFEKGKLNGLSFDLQGNNHAAKAKIKVLYKDLKLSLMEKDKGAKETDRKFLASILANMVIKNDNPKGSEPARESQVDYQRDPNRSLFNLCWKAMFKGIKETLGVKK